MWLKVDERVLINVDQKVVKMVKSDTPLKQGGTAYEISFYNTLEKGAKPSFNYQWEIAGDRDTAFNLICQQLEIIDVSRIEK